MKHSSIILALAAAILATGCCNQHKKLTDAVDPMIGSGGHGHVFVGACVPFGMVQLGPSQIKDSWDWCSGYHISDTLLIGFSHTHLSGTGIGELGDVLLLPFDESKTLRAKDRVNNKKREIGHIYAHLDHSREIVRPGFYSVELPDYGVKARLTTTERVGFHEYTFEGDNASLLVDLCTGIGWDSCTVKTLRVIDPTHIEGSRRSSGWAKDHTWYFAAELSHPIISQGTEQLENDGVVDILRFDTSRDHKLMVKVALSPVSCDGARANMAAELPGWNFDKTAKAADRKWEEELSRIQIEPMDERQEKIFYTSFYHTMITPELFSDSGETPLYTILSLWDTYRAQFPLLTLVQPEIASALADTYMDIYSKQGKLPVWHLDGCETDCMVGNPGVISMADLILKGYAKDPKAAFEAMKASSELDDRGMDAHRKYGFIPYDCTSETETVAKSMEFGIADGCVAKVAKTFGDDAAVEEFTWRSKAYQRYFDSRSGFIRGRDLKGHFRTPFNPYRAEWLADDYTEGNAWQYTFLVPHDVQGLIDLFGQERFIEKIDSLFIAEGDLGETAADVTGLVGQYAHGNEPSHHVAYMYNWIPGQQHKCARIVRHIMDELYFDDENGVCGNEDCGQMSAWYVLSSLGLYQVDPACGDFAIGSPVVKAARVRLPEGKTLTIKADGNSPENIYVQKIIFNGAVLDRPFISWKDLKEGGELEYVMGPNPFPGFNEHRDLNTINIGKAETKRTETIFYNSRKEALSKSFNKSGNYISLNGIWDFRYEGGEPSKIKVPGNWERQGYGDAIYVNTTFDFAPVNPQPPVLPEHIPSGVYSRSFNADFNRNERLYLNLCGVKGGCYVIVNDRMVGYSEDAKDLVRYDITPFVKRGKKNDLKVVVYKWSTGSYLECMDFWRLTGFERDVYLSKETTSVPEYFDFNVVSTLAEDLSTGIFRLSVKDGEKCGIAYELLDRDGRTILSGSGKDSWEAEIPAVRKWSAETPELYTLLLKVGNQYTRADVGFRRLEIVGNQFLVNGQTVKFKGVNLHEHDQYTGHHVTREVMLENLKQMRRFNINAIRTCHYPQPRYFYELCDSLGFYVYDESNVESHGMGYDLDRTLGNNPAWKDKHLDRIGNMYFRTRNYPCTTILSLGNEGGNGCNFYDAYRMLKEWEKDGQNRPVCYERAEFEWNTDMLVPQYPGAEWFRRMGEGGSDRPVCPSEYAHAMGNSTGSLDLQWEHIYKHANLQGGFIWDWIDQGLAETDENGRKYWTYGGDYGKDSQSDGNFNCNGIVTPDLEPHPGIWEVKHVYQDLSITANDARKGRFHIFNRFHFTSLEGYATSWNITADGKELASGALDFKTAAQKGEDFSIEMPELPLDADCYINFVTCTKSATPLLEKGHVVATDQILIHEGTRVDMAVRMMDPFESEEGQLLVLTMDDTRIAFDRQKGYLSEYSIADKPLFDQEFGLRPSFWRAPNDNDYGCWWPGRTQAFKTSSREFNVEACFENGAIRADYRLASGNLFTVRYRIMEGTLKVDYDLGATNNGGRAIEVPRIGFRMRLPASADKFTYFGRGPQENYIDRFSGAQVGLYTSSADAEFVPYVRLQECGHHTGCKMLAIGDMTVRAENFEFNALRCSVEDLDGEDAVGKDYQWLNKNPQTSKNPEDAKNNLRRQTHINDYTARDYVELSIDGCQSGIGGYDSWGATAEKERTLWSDRSYSYGFTLVPAAIMDSETSMKYSF